MSFSSSYALLRVPSFSPAVLAILLTILAEAVAGSYMALLAVQKIGMSPLELSLFLTVSAASGIAVTTWFGHMHDRRPKLWPLYLALSAKVIGFGLCAVVTQTWALVAIALLLIGPSSASFALLFAIAKGYLDVAGGDAPERGMAALRLTSSLGWAIGPAIGAILVAMLSFGGVYFGAAVMAMLGFGVVLAARVAPRAAIPERPRMTLDVVLAAAPGAISLTAFHTAMFMGSNATSILVVQGLGTEVDVGLLFSLCAALEVVIMGAFVVRPQLSHNRPLLIAGFAMFAAYFLLVMTVPTLATFYWGQLLRAGAIGIVSIVGMARLQQMLPGRAGVASALYGNTMSAAALISGLGTGLWANAFGYWSIFWVCAALSVLGGVVMLRRPKMAATTP